MTGADILKSPVRTYKDRVAVYYFDGRVHCDILAPAGPERDAVLALVGQAQAALSLLLDFYKNYEMGERPDAQMAKVLRDAGVLSPSPDTVGR